MALAIKELNTQLRVVLAEERQISKQIRQEQQADIEQRMGRIVPLMEQNTTLNSEFETILGKAEVSKKNHDKVKGLFARIKKDLKK